MENHGHSGRQRNGCLFQMTAGRRRRTFFTQGWEKHRYQIALREKNLEEDKWKNTNKNSFRPD